MGTTIRMDYEVVDLTRNTLRNGSQEMMDRLNQLAKDMMSLGDGQGRWVQAFAEMKQTWDQKMSRLVSILDVTSEQLKQSAIALQDADHASAQGFNRISL